MNKKGMVRAALVAMAGAGIAHGNEAGELGAQELSALVQRGVETFEWGLLLETEGAYGRISGESESDLVLATVELAMDASANEWLRGHVCLLWEEDDTEENNLDEAYIVLGASESCPWYLSAGRYYLPFGNFESAFVSDPLTLELAEINQSSVMAGFGNDWIGLNAGVFKGDIKAGADTDRTVSDAYASVCFAPAECFHFGAYWLSDLMETATQSELGLGLEPGYEKQGGAGAYANVFAGAFMFNAEYVAALDGYEMAGGRYTPCAFNLEASLAFAEKWTVGVKFEGSDDLYAAYDAGFEEKCHGAAYGAVVSCGFYDHAAVAVEYLHLEELDGGEDGDLVTVQLALEI